ncbi:MAG: hypothetical protein KDD25_00245 [Bdellovibrionales bacterium]|nr:hypothetical protein [Bdellovibrionales bacterium]
MNLFKKIFGKGGDSSVIEVIEATLEGVLDRAGLDLSFDVKAESNEEYLIELFGEDEELLKEKEGQLLDAIQFYTKRVVQHQLPESRVKLEFDSNGYREEADQALVELAERLRDMALEKQKSVYCKALPPKDRRIIHQHLSEDDRVKTKSIGDGHYKKIKIFPANGAREGAGGRRNNKRHGGPRRNGNRNPQRSETREVNGNR